MNYSNKDILLRRILHIGYILCTEWLYILIDRWGFFAARQSPKKWIKSRDLNWYFKDVIMICYFSIFVTFMIENRLIQKHAFLQHKGRSCKHIEISNDKICCIFSISDTFCNQFIMQNDIRIWQVASIFLQIRLHLTCFTIKKIWSDYSSKKNFLPFLDQNHNPNFA